MNTKILYEIKETLCTDLEPFAKKRNMTKSEVDSIFAITGAINNMNKIIRSEDEGYSYGDGNWSANGSYSNGMPMMDGRYSNRRGSYMSNGNSGRRYSGDGYINDTDDMESRMRREMY